MGLGAPDKTLQRNDLLKNAPGRYAIGATTHRIHQEEMLKPRTEEENEWMKNILGEGSDVDEDNPANVEFQYWAARMNEHNQGVEERGTGDFMGSFEDWLESVHMSSLEEWQRLVG